MRHLIPLSLLTALAMACSGSMYTLPNPAPESEWVNVLATEKEDEQAKLKRTLAAKKAALDLYEALDTGRWDDAVALMSQETRNFLDEASGGQGAAAALESGKIELGDKAMQFRPTEVFFIDGLANIKDEVPGAPPEAETQRRKELYAISRDGRARKLVFIYEADAWRLHSPVLGDEPFTLGSE